MENNSVGSKIGNFLRKMYHFRVKVDRKGKPVVNVSSIFGALCLIFAPHMTIIGLVAALLLGYQIHFESEADDGLLGDQIRKAADNIRTGAVNAAKSIQQEIDRARTNNTDPAAASRPQQAEPETAESVPSNDDLLKELASHAETAPESNPAATTFHSAYAASAGSVPILEVKEETGNDPEPPVSATQSRE